MEKLTWCIWKCSVCKCSFDNCFDLQKHQQAHKSKNLNPTALEHENEAFTSNESNFPASHGTNWEWEEIYEPVWPTLKQVLANVTVAKVNVWTNPFGPICRPSDTMLYQTQAQNLVPVNYGPMQSDLPTPREPSLPVPRQPSLASTPREYSVPTSREPSLPTPKEHSLPVPRQPSLAPTPREYSVPTPREPGLPTPREHSLPVPRQPSLAPTSREYSVPTPREPSLPTPREHSLPVPRQPSLAPTPREYSLATPREPSVPTPRQDINPNYTPRQDQASRVPQYMPAAYATPIQPIAIPHVAYAPVAEPILPSIHHGGLLTYQSSPRFEKIDELNVSQGPCSPYPYSRPPPLQIGSPPRYPAYTAPPPPMSPAIRGGIYQSPPRHMSYAGHDMHQQRFTMGHPNMSPGNIQHQRNIIHQAPTPTFSMAIPPPLVVNPAHFQCLVCSKVFQTLEGFNIHFNEHLQIR